jgi:ribonuclease HI
MPERNPDTAKKLARFIELWRSGATLEEAAKRAGVPLETARGFIDSIKGSLEEEASGASRPARPARPKRRKKTGLRLSAVCDGASRGNPGAAACAVIIYDADGDELLRRARVLGNTTNNVAEYQGVLLALELATELGAAELELRLDSELVVRQLNGEYKVKNAGLKPHFRQVQDRLSRFARVDIEHVPRSETKAADQLANDALDGKLDA